MGWRHGGNVRKWVTRNGTTVGRIALLLPLRPIRIITHRIFFMAATTTTTGMMMGTIRGLDYLGTFRLIIFCFFSFFLLSLSFSCTLFTFFSCTLFTFNKDVYVS